MICVKCSLHLTFSHTRLESYELLEAWLSVLYNPLIPYNAFLTLESRETHFKEKRISGYP